MAIITSSSEAIMAAKHLKPWIWQRPEWPEFYWDSARLAQPLAAARRAQGELSGMARLLDPNSDLHAKLAILTSEGIATSAIEGCSNNAQHALQAQPRECRAKLVVFGKAPLQQLL